MNGYLFTAGLTQSRIQPSPGGDNSGLNSIQTWDACQSLIVCADSADDAQTRFETWLGTRPDGESLVQVRINRLVAAQVMEQLLTETGPVPIDWPSIAKQAQAELASTAADDFEQGYWADVNAVVPPRELSLSVGALQQSLPEEVQSGLNWSADRNFFFLLSVLSPPRPPAEPAYEMEEDLGAATREEDPDDPGTTGLGLEPVNFPELVDKEAAVLVRARNSVVAAWLWRKFSANLPLAGNPIRIDPWCGAMGGADTGKQ